jgi:hypothetical protein
MRAGIPLCLLLAMLQGDGVAAQHVRQLLLESPTFERGLLSMQDTWLDVLHSSEDAPFMPLVSVRAKHLRHACWSVVQCLQRCCWAVIGSRLPHLQWHLVGTCATPA